MGHTEAFLYHNGVRVYDPCFDFFGRECISSVFHLNETDVRLRATKVSRRERNLLFSIESLNELSELPWYLILSLNGSSFLSLKNSIEKSLDLKLANALPLLLRKARNPRFVTFPYYHPDVNKDWHYGLLGEKLINLGFKVTEYTLSGDEKIRNFLGTMK